MVALKLGLALLTLTVSVSAAPPLLEARQAITTLSTSQITAFRPFTHYASTAYCNPSTTLNWTCGANCDANPTFKPVASGGDGNGTQFCKQIHKSHSHYGLIRSYCVGYVGYDPTLETVIVAHQGTNRSAM